MGNTGNTWWPKSNDSAKTLNYTLSSDGYLTIYANRTAHILATIGPLIQNMTLYLKVGDVVMASAQVKVNGTPYLRMTSVSCGDLWLNPTSGGLSDIAYITYGGTVDCRVGFINQGVNPK